MVFQSIEEIKERIKNPVNEEMLRRAKIILKKLQLHVCGVGLDEYVDKIQGIENDGAVSLRRALGKVITKPETSKIISVFNKIFSARGGGRFYDFDNKDHEQRFADILNNVRDGQAMADFMRKEWKELVNIDPNGVLFIENDKENNISISFKSCESFRDIGYKSPTKIEYIIFEPEIILDENKREKAYLYRVVDDQNDYIVKVQDNEYSFVEDLTFKNVFGYVPACFISDRKDKKSEGFISHIDECLIHADDLLLDYTIYKIYKTKIGIPLHWQYQRACATCNGSGMINLDEGEKKCAKCEGNGYDNKDRDIADIIILPIPEQGDIQLSPPAGYVSGDIETWEKMEATQDRVGKKMYTAIWGESSTIDADRRNITASELTVRENSKEDKLNDISDNEELVEKFLTDTFGRFYFPNTYNGCIIHNGRIFDIKTSDQFLNEYNLGVTAGIPSTMLTEILSDYYHTLYKRNPKKLNESLIKLYTKPFYHWPPIILQTARVNDTDYLKNLYYDEFVSYYENKKESLGIATIEAVQKELDIWIKTKSLKEVEINTQENGNTRFEKA